MEYGCDSRHTEYNKTNDRENNIFSNKIFLII